MEVLVSKNLTEKHCARRGEFCWNSSYLVSKIFANIPKWQNALKMSWREKKRVQSKNLAKHSTINWQFQFEQNCPFIFIVWSWLAVCILKYGDRTKNSKWPTSPAILTHQVLNHFHGSILLKLPANVYTIMVKMENHICL
jgi:hypothetical protein